ncbi:ABC transporter permease [Microbacterium sp. SLBN-146]|uniref:ABC transporter permease n=1 Tax=Microbacterium sp. SLBN-146 TaxID=2768457 RepID=UPI0011503292|nr:polyketide antibiotic transporter [Microbacterium sp. SLBN-146]TQJ30989.1 ABC-2 type transport system permease protein [Microbacterium sp. SLBN-146]
MTRALVRAQLRRERWLLPIWMLGILGLLAASGIAVAREFGDEQERIALAAVAAGNPAFLFLRGLPDGAETGALVFFQTFAFLAILTGLMNTFLVVRHTRADEERGRAELIAATPIARTLPLRVTLGIALAADVLLAAGAAGIGLALGYELRSAVVMAAAIGAIGVCFAGIAALAAQVMPSSRGANGLAAAIVGVAYLIRGIGDALGTATDLTSVSPSWISFLSPIGWAQATAPFSSADPLPLLAVVGLGAVTGVAAILVRARRDLGESLIAERTGRPVWARASAGRLAVRMQRGSTIGWAIGAGILGLFAGLLSPVVAEAVAENDALAELIGRLSPGLEVDTGAAFTVALLGLSATLATAAGVQAMTRMRADEAEGRAELLLSTPLPRGGWLGRQLVVAIGAMIIVAITGGFAAGMSLAATGGGAERIPESLAAVGVFLPAGAVFVTLTALAFATVPRETIALGWGLLAVGLVLGQFGDLLGLPEWLQDVSPLRHVPAVPIEPIDPWALALPLAAAAVFAGGAFALLRRRDVPA